MPVYYCVHCGRLSVRKHDMEPCPHCSTRGAIPVLLAVSD